LLTTTDALSHTSSNSYNNRFWITSTTDANSATTSYGYDAHGNRTSLTDSVGNEDQYTYSATNQVLTDTNQLGYAITYVFNASGDLTQETDRNGLVRDFTYDNDHRETAEKWMSGGTAIYTIAYAYNADNAVTSASDPDSSYAYTYDHLGRVTSLDNSSTPNIPHVVLTSQYDAMNNRTQLTANMSAADARTRQSRLS
jgi:YD repeat-containing protein